MPTVILPLKPLTAKELEKEHLSEVVHRDLKPSGSSKAKELELPKSLDACIPLAGERGIIFSMSAVDTLNLSLVMFLNWKRKLTVWSAEQENSEHLRLCVQHLHDLCSWAHEAKHHNISKRADSLKADCTYSMKQFEVCEGDVA